MNERSARRTARVILAADILALIGTAVLFAPDFESYPLIAFLLVAVIGWGGVGVLIAARAPSNPIGWLLLAVASSAALYALGSAYTGWGVVHGANDLPFSDAIGWVSAVATVVVGLTAVPMLFLLYPDGALLSRGWRGAAAAAAAGGVAFGVLTVHAGDPDRGLYPPAWARSDVFGLASFAGPALLIGVSIAAVISLWLRLRRAPAAERGTIRWLLILLAAMVLTVPLPLVLDWFGFVIATLVILPGVFFGIPFAFSVVLLRYGLYDYEVTVRKRIVATALAVGLTFVIAFVVGLISLALGGVIGGTGPDIAIGAALGAVGAAVLYGLARVSWRFSRRVVFGDRATPYEVLSEFSERVASTYSTDDVLPRMAQLLARSSGATHTHVWLRVGSELRPVASWPDQDDGLHPLPMPDGALPAFPDGLAAFPVTHGGTTLGALSLRSPSNDPMNPAKERLANDLAAQAGLVLHNVALLEDLRESRRRIVTAADERARRLERDIHDGAQQQLVALAVRAKVAQDLAGRDPTKALAMLDKIREGANGALEDLRDLARGIYPPLLADKGLVAAIEAQARKTAMAVNVSTEGVARYAQEVEAAVYFCVLEALNNVAKYAGAGRVDVHLRSDDHDLLFEVVDDGAGFDADRIEGGTGLQGMADRLAALGGTLAVTSAPQGGTTVRGSVPM